MKKLALIIFGLVAISLAGGVAAKKPGGGDTLDPDTDDLNGNGAPSGPHYNLNMIGLEDYQNPSSGSNGNGHRIFVKIQGKTKINLMEGPPTEFEVIDYNGTDGEATFALPNPDDNCDGITDYSVFVRAGGGNGGSATVVSCGEDMNGVSWCSAGEFTVELSKNGRERFMNVSRELLYVTVDDGAGLHRIPLFDSSGAAYWWDYDNNGLRLAQFRFYPIPSDVNDGLDCGPFLNP